MDYGLWTVWTVWTIWTMDKRGLQIMEKIMEKRIFPQYQAFSHN